MTVVTVNLTNYPSLQTITNLARSLVRDDMAGATGTVGEGQILVDNMQTSITMANLFNSAVRELCRELRMAASPVLIADNYIISGIPPMNGPLGLQVADPSVQVAVGFNGYFDGTGWYSTYCLPQGLFQVLKCSERETGSQSNFSDMSEPANGLAGVAQTNGWGSWEWRQDQVWMPGALTTRDLRLRYLMTLQPQFVANANPATTYLPIMDCEEAVAKKIVRDYDFRQGSAMYPAAAESAMDATYRFLNEHVRRQQGTNYTPVMYGTESPAVLDWGM